MIEKHGVDANMASKDNTSLIAACLNGSIKICKYLIEKHGVDVNKVVECYTPLIAAC